MIKSGVCLLAGAAIVGFSGSASAVTDTNFTYSAYKLGIYAINVTDMAPDSSATAGVGGSGGYITYFLDGVVVGQGTASGCYMTGVHLPQGAYLYAVQAYYKSGVAASQPSLFFGRQQFYTGAVTSILEASLANDTNTRTLYNANITNNTHRYIDNVSYSYSFAFCLPPGDQFEGARIFYHYNSAGD